MLSFLSVLHIFYTVDYEPDIAYATEQLYMSNDVYTIVIATANRLNNLLIQADDEDTILDDLCRIFRERKSMLFVHTIVLQSDLTYFLVYVPIKSWFSAHSISSQLIAYRQSTSYMDDSPPASFDWELVIRRHVLPFWRHVNSQVGVWLSIDTVKSASISMPAVKHLTSEIEATYALVRSTRYHILMSHCLAWSWLESICAYHSQPHIAQDIHSSSWPCNLARHLYMVFETRFSTFTLWPSDFIPHLFSELQTFCSIGMQEFSLVDCVPTLQQLVYLQMKRILQKWLDFPQDNMADCRAWLVQNFISVFGPGSLLLDEAWDIYQHVPKHVLGRPRKQIRTIFLHQLIPFFHHIGSCEAAFKDSPARTLLDQYQKEFSMVGSGRGQNAAVGHLSSIEVVDSFQGQSQSRDEVPNGVDSLTDSSEEDLDMDMDMDMARSPSTLR